MKRKYVIGIDGSGIDEAIAGIEQYKNWLESRCKILVQRLSEIGCHNAKIVFSTARYAGENDVSVNIEQRGETACAVVATGEATLFIEFGSGITLGYGYPKAGDYGMGPGTYPSAKGHWDDPNGWYLPKEKGGGHTFGNPPYGAMYSGVKEMGLEFEKIVREVFSPD